MDFWGGGPGPRHGGPDTLKDRERERDITLQQRGQTGVARKQPMSVLTTLMMKDGSLWAIHKVPSGNLILFYSSADSLVPEKSRHPLLTWAVKPYLYWSSRNFYDIFWSWKSVSLVTCIKDSIFKFFKKSSIKKELSSSVKKNVVFDWKNVVFQTLRASS